jgi:hypothetical protein
MVCGAGGGLQARSASRESSWVRSCCGARLGAGCQGARSRKAPRLPAWEREARVRREVERRKGGLDGALSRIGNPLTGKLRSEVEAHGPAGDRAQCRALARRSSSRRPPTTPAHRRMNMRAEGLEPPHLSAPAPKAGVSANSTTPARVSIVRHAFGPTCFSSRATLWRCEIEMLRWLDCVQRRPSCSQVAQKRPRMSADMFEKK